MGLPKLLLPVKDDLSLLETAVWAVAEHGPVVVVTGAYDREIREHLTELHDLLTKNGITKFLFATNTDWDSGMSGSIAVGVKAAGAFTPAAYCITLADQPGIDAATIGRYHEAFLRNPQAIVATWYPERLGVPAIFPARYAEALSDGTGKNGARALIATAGENVVAIHLPESPFDIDTPEDYERLTGRKPGE
jgi:CTP:molybdopterin cytidylyltransferase MocA